MRTNGRQIVAMPVERGRPGIGGGRALASQAQQICCACDAIKGVDDGTPYAREGDARFCADCWRRLPAAEIARMVREVALRGVPLS